MSIKAQDFSGTPDQYRKIFVRSNAVRFAINTSANPEDAINFAEGLYDALYKKGYFYELEEGTIKSKIDTLEQLKAALADKLASVIAEGHEEVEDQQDPLERPDLVIYTDQELRDIISLGVDIMQEAPGPSVWLWSKTLQDRFEHVLDMCRKALNHLDLLKMGYDAGLLAVEKETRGTVFIRDGKIVKKDPEIKFGKLYQWSGFLKSMDYEIMLVRQEANIKVRQIIDRKNNK